MRTDKPNTKPVAPKHEIRVIRTSAKMEVRKAADGTRSVSGYFATFGTLSHDMGFRERLMRGCFANSLRTQPVSCLFNHDQSKLLGRTESQTLDVCEDETGLRFNVKLPDTSYANDLVSLLERGDSFECSFGFAVPEGGDEWTSLPDGQLLRTINEALLYEGSILVSPAAYPNTSASIRSMPAELREEWRKKKKHDDDEFDDDDSDSDDDDDDDDDEDEDRCIAYRAYEAVRDVATICDCGKRDCMSTRAEDDEERNRYTTLLIHRLMKSF